MPRTPCTPCTHGPPTNFQLWRSLELETGSVAWCGMPTYDKRVRPSPLPLVFGLELKNYPFYPFSPPQNYQVVSENMINNLELLWMVVAKYLLGCQCQVTILHWDNCISWSQINCLWNASPVLIIKLSLDLVNHSIHSCRSIFTSLSITLRIHRKSAD